MSRDPAGLELADDELEDRPLADRHQRLRQDRRVRREARAAAAREDDRLHAAEVASGATSPRRRADCHSRLGRPSHEAWRSTERARGDLPGAGPSGAPTLRRPVSRWTATSRRTTTAPSVHQRIRSPSERARRRVEADPSASSAAGCSQVVADAIARDRGSRSPSRTRAGRARDAGLHGEDRVVRVGLELDEAWILRARADEAHLALEHVPELRQLVELRRGEEAAEAREALVLVVVSAGPAASSCIFRNFSIRTRAARTHAPAAVEDARPGLSSLIVATTTRNTGARSRSTAAATTTSSPLERAVEPPATIRRGIEPGGSCSPRPRFDARRMTPAATRYLSDSPASAAFARTCPTWVLRPESEVSSTT